jgi:hypothetical protein
MHVHFPLFRGFSLENSRLENRCLLTWPYFCNKTLSVHTVEPLSLALVMSSAYMFDAPYPYFKNFLESGKTSFERKIPYCSLTISDRDFAGGFLRVVREMWVFLENRDWS